MRNRYVFAVGVLLSIMVVISCAHNQYVKLGEPGEYQDFLREIRRRRPGVPILCGSVRKELLSDWLREIVDEKSAAGEKALYWYAFSRLGSGEFGCDHNPNAKAQKRFAQEITPLITEATGRKPVADEGATKYNPGHYVAVGPGPTDELAQIKYLDDPAVKGVNKRYFWRTLEPERGVYDFTLMANDLEYLEEHGKQLVVFVMDKSFSEKSALPPYLSEYELHSDQGGFAPVRWHPVVVERLVALGKALGERFDSHPNFEGMAIQESSLGITEEGYGAFGYTAEKYRDALIAVLTGVQAALPNSHVFWYSNFLPGNDGYLHQVADAIEDRGVFMGGPDILLYRRFLSRVSYPMYEEYRDRLTLFCSAQGDSYKHHKNDSRVDEQEPIHEEGYVTMEEIFLFARDSLHVRYLFWDYEYEGIEQGYRTYDDAMEVIRKYPVFNNSKGPLRKGEY